LIILTDYAWRGLLLAIARGFLVEFVTSSRRSHTLKLKKGWICTDLRQHIFSDRNFYIWNHLEATVAESGIVITFESRLHKLNYKDEPLFR